LFIYSGFCLHVEQPYRIITRTSQTLSSKLEKEKQNLNFEKLFLVPMEITENAHEIATKWYEKINKIFYIISLI